MMLIIMIIIIFFKLLISYLIFNLQIQISLLLGSLYMTDLVKKSKNNNNNNNGSFIYFEQNLKLQYYTSRPPL